MGSRRLVCVVIKILCYQGSFNTKSMQRDIQSFSELEIDAMCCIWPDEGATCTFIDVVAHIKHLSDLGVWVTG